MPCCKKYVPTDKFIINILIKLQSLFEALHVSKCEQEGTVLGQ